MEDEYTRILRCGGGNVRILKCRGVNARTLKCGRCKGSGIMSWKVSRIHSDRKATGNHLNVDVQELPISLKQEGL